MKWTEEEKKWLERNYKKKSMKQCSDHLKRSPAAIAQFACKHGLKSGRYLTEKQKSYFEQYVGIKSYEELAKRFGKSYEAIKCYASKNGLIQRDGAYNRITITELSRILHRDRKSIDKTWSNRGLVFYKVGKYKMIDLDNLFDVMKNNTDIWRANDVDDFLFIRFDWFNEKKKNEIEETAKERWKDWA